MTNFWNEIRKIITSDKFHAVISITCAVIMYYAPDNIDSVIIAFLAAGGFKILKLEEEPKP
jgi:hypothetical protein